MPHNTPPLGTRVTGFSLSFCIQQIIEGHVRLEDVDHVYTACSRELNWDPQAREQVFERYVNSYWKDHDKARMVFNALHDNHRITHCGPKALVNTWLPTEEFNARFGGSWLQEAKWAAHDLNHEEPHPFTPEELVRIYDHLVAQWDAQYDRYQPSQGMQAIEPDSDALRSQAKVAALDFKKGGFETCVITGLPLGWIDPDPTDEVVTQQFKPVMPRWIITDRNDPNYRLGTPCLLLRQDQGLTEPHARGIEQALGQCLYEVTNTHGSFEYEVDGTYRTISLDHQDDGSLLVRVTPDREQEQDQQVYQVQVKLVHLGS